MSRLRFVIGNVTDFEELGIDTSGQRKSLDGTKTFIHQESLGNEQFNSVIAAIVSGKPFSFGTNDSAEFVAMLESEDWSGE